MWNCRSIFHFLLFNLIPNRLLSPQTHLPSKPKYRRKTQPSVAMAISSSSGSNSIDYPSSPSSSNLSASNLDSIPESRVKKTGRNRSGNRGYRSNRPGPVPVPAGFKPAQIQILNLNFKTWKNPKKFLKILQVATNLMVSNFFKYSFI